MPGRNRRNRGPSRNDFRNTQTYDQPPNNRPRPACTFGPTSQDGPQRRSHTQTHNPSSGIHRPNDNSNPGLGSRFRNLKQQSDIVKRELEDLISQIDELQPDAAAMDWAGSAGTIVYVPMARAADGSFQQAQMVSISTGEYPNAAATFMPYAENIHARVSNGNRPETPVTFTPHADSMCERASSGTTLSSASRSSTAMQGEGFVGGRDMAIPEYGRASAGVLRDSVVRPLAAQGDVTRCGLAPLPRNGLVLPEPREMGASVSDREDQHGNAYTTPESSYRAGSCPGNLNSYSYSNLGGQRTNQARAPFGSLLTPPPSPVGGLRASEVREFGHVALQEG